MSRRGGRCAGSAPALKVRFTHDVFGLQRVGGVSRYVVELHKAMLRRHVDSLIVSGFHINEYLAGCPRALGFGLRASRVRRLLRSCNEAMCLLGASAEVLHRSYHGSTARYGCKVRATTVYDMIPELLIEPNGKQSHASSIKRADCETADLILAISEVTRQDLHRLWKIPLERVVVTHLGVARVPPSHRQWRDEYGDYLLHVGRRGGYKNFLGLLPAAARVLPAAKASLVCFGGGEPTLEEKKAIEQLGLVDRVAFVAGSDSDLAACYCQAIGHVTASLYEGFGLTPVEAMQYGCPVACTNRGSFPEVVGDAAITFDPASGVEQENALRSLAEGRSAHQSMVARGYRRSADFSWDRTAELTDEAYRRFLAH